MSRAKATIGSKIKRVIATALLATTLATSISLSPARAIEVQAKASETGHTKKVSMKPFIWSSLNTDPSYTGKLDVVIKACGINKNMTEYEAVERLNDWITKNIKYDYDHSTYKYEISVLTTLKYKEGVCEHYASLFMALCDRVGIKSTKVLSDEQEHAWNLVQVDGVWYHIDTCWNVVDTKKWFLLSESEILKDHGKISEIDGGKNNKELESYFTECIYSNNEYNIKYNLKGGKNNKSNIKTYYVAGDKRIGYHMYTKAHQEGKNLDSFKFKNPTKSGYEFKGWYYKGKKITKLKQIKGKTNVTLTAKWTKLPKPTLKNVKMDVQKASDRYTFNFKWKKVANTYYEIKLTEKYPWGDHTETFTTQDGSEKVCVLTGHEYKITLRAYTKDSTGKKVYSKTTKTFTGVAEN